MKTFKIPFKGFDEKVFSLGPFIFSGTLPLDPWVINRETIRWKQELELLFIFYLLIQICPRARKAMKKEREEYQKNLAYPRFRTFLGWLQFFEIG
jgi:hypothetical protein